MEEKHSPLRSPTSYREDDGDKAALHRLIHALEKGGLGRRAGGLDDCRSRSSQGTSPLTQPGTTSERGRLVSKDWCQMTPRMDRC